MNDLSRLYSGILVFPCQRPDQIKVLLQKKVKGRKSWRVPSMFTSSQDVLKMVTDWIMMQEPTTTTPARNSNSKAFSYRVASYIEYIAEARHNIHSS